MLLSKMGEDLLLARGPKCLPLCSIFKVNSAKAQTPSHCLFLKGLNCIASLAFLLMLQLPSHFLGFLHIFYNVIYNLFETFVK